MKIYDKSVSCIEENGRIIRFSSLVFPKLFEIIILYVLNTINTFMLSGYPGQAVAAVSLSSQILNLATNLISMIITGSMIITSIEFGKKNIQTAGRICGTSLVTVSVLSFIIGCIISVFSKQLLVFLNAEPEVLPLGTGYLRLMGIFLIFTMLMSIFNNFLICNGYSSCVFISGIVCNVLNVVFGYMVLYSGIKLPIHPVTALAVASAVARCFGLAISIAFFKAKKCPLIITLKPRIVKKIFKFGIPAGMNGFSYTLAQTITTGFIAAQGLTVLNTKIYVSSIIIYSYCVSGAMGSANSILTGRYKGRQDYSSMIRMNNQHIRVAIFFNLLISGILYIFHIPLIRLFTDNPDIISLAGKIMLLDIIVECSRAVNNILDQSLNANGDVKTVLSVSVCACWIFSVLGSYILSIKLGMGLAGIWIAFIMDESFKAISYLIRWKKGKWKNIII